MRQLAFSNGRELLSLPSHTAVELGGRPTGSPSSHGLGTASFHFTLPGHSLGSLDSVKHNSEIAELDVIHS